jgi:alkylhydroperoxidase family enzyme
MALIPYLTADKISKEHRFLLERPITLHRALVNSPHALTHFQNLAEWIRWDCELDPRVRGLLILLIGYLTRDPYEWSHHLVLGSQFGVTDDDDIRGVINVAEGKLTSLTPDEVTVLEASRQLTNERHIADATWAKLTELYPPARLTDLVIVASFYCMVVRVLGGLRIDVEPEYQQALKRFPLPND